MCFDWVTVLMETPMNTDDLVSVLVPRRFLAQVYGFVAKLDSEEERIGGSGPAPGNEPAEIVDNTSSRAIADEWSPSLLRRMVNESSPELRRILEALADRPGSWLSTGALALAIGESKDQSKDQSKIVGGTISAFWRRIKGRYQLKSFPFDRRTDHLKRIDCRMSAGTAKLVKQFIDERNER